MLTIEQFTNMGYDNQTVNHLIEIQKAFQEGRTVSILIDHHTDEDLLSSIEKNQLDSNCLTIKNVEWESGQVWFEKCEGWAGVNEVIPF